MAIWCHDWSGFGAWVAHDRDVNERPVPHRGRRLQPVETDTGMAVRNAVELGRMDAGAVVYVPPWVADGPGGFFRVVD